MTSRLTLCSGSMRQGGNSGFSSSSALWHPSIAKASLLWLCSKNINFGGKRSRAHKLVSTSLFSFLLLPFHQLHSIEWGHQESIMKRAKASVRTVQTQLSFSNHSGNTPAFQEQKELSNTPENCDKYLRSGKKHIKRAVAFALLRVFEHSTDFADSVRPAKLSW